MLSQIRNPKSQIRNGQLFGMICALLSSNSLPEISTIAAIKLDYPIIITRTAKRYPWAHARGESL